MVTKTARMREHDQLSMGRSSSRSASSTCSCFRSSGVSPTPAPNASQIGPTPRLGRIVKCVATPNVWARATA